MTNINHYYDVFQKAYPFLGSSDIELIKSNSSIVELGKKEYWQNGRAHAKVAFIVSGTVRAYFIDKKGEEVTTIIRTAGKTMVTPGAIPGSDTRHYFSQAVQDSILIEITLPTLLTLCPQHERLFQFFVFNTADHLNALVERVEHLITLNPEERVTHLLQDRKVLMDNVPQKYLANFIGITPVSLSRLLKKITSS